MSHIDREIGVAKIAPRAKVNARLGAGRQNQAPHPIGVQRTDVYGYTRPHPKTCKRSLAKPASTRPDTTKQQADQLMHDAIYGLNERHQEQSARTGLTRNQSLVLWSALGVSIAGVAMNWIAFAIIINVMALTLATLLLVLRIVLLDSHEDSGVIDPAQFPSLNDKDLPVYTLLIPLLREAEILPDLIQALNALDYPKDKLDIKLILEADDKDTIDAVRALHLPTYFDPIIVPDARPKTKPKACNYALHFARGDVLVIFDAEDQPDPQQLRHAARIFAATDDKLACLQARLNYHNHNENWLTQQFTVEYSVWFRLVLPGLKDLKFPVPLGGTSNHFRIGVLRQLGAWDAFNVTEDADPGHAPQRPWLCLQDPAVDDRRRGQLQAGQLAASTLAMAKGLFANLSHPYASTAQLCQTGRLARIAVSSVGHCRFIVCGIGPACVFSVRAFNGSGRR